MTNVLKESIRIADGFQYSVNIGFDINNEDKIRDFIPTIASLDIMEDILLSTFDSSTDRAKILIGAYGKGKSHIVLELLALLKDDKERAVFERLLTSMQRIKPKLYDYVIDYYENEKKLFPIVVQSNATSLSQAFLSSMQRSLVREELVDLLPDTHFQAAISRIEDWRINYHQTYEQFVVTLNEPVTEFISRLSDFDSNAYEKFVEIFPKLTSGSTFNPLLGLDVLDLYSNVTEKLTVKGYNGIFVVYDEFSKFLEAGINQVSQIDIKLLQDFAEKCNRSKEKQMHLLLISHKDITNYIDKLPKNRVDGWRGVSERFKHLEIHNNFSQVYEIIATIINQDKGQLADFFGQYQNKFTDLKDNFSELFTDLYEEQKEIVVRDCYPLHPISTFILPRLSEKVAQNERTLFTFLASKNKNTLSTFLEQNQNEFPMLTPDLIYDYFESLFKKEVYTSEVHKLYLLVNNILNRLEPDSISCKIVKTIALIYIVAQFEKLPPTPEIITNAYRETVTDISEITQALLYLKEKQYVVYLNRSNNFLKLKDNLGIDVGAKISDEVEKVRAGFRVKDILNNVSLDSYLYPVKYNDENEVIRYFDFVFIESEEFYGVENWDKKIAGTSADGVVYGIIPKDADDINEITKRLENSECLHEQVVFVLPQKESEIDKIAFEYQAVINLKSQAELNKDEALVEEYNIYIEDLGQIIDQYISIYLKPETRQAVYYHKGKSQRIFRKAQISQLLSSICETVYSQTPVINNEAINKDILPSVAINSRTKVITGLLNNKLEPNLGLNGTGQDVSILRSTLVMTNILEDWESAPKLMVSENRNEKIQNVLNTITHFFRESNQEEPQNFQVLYERLIKADYHIGLKKGVIPIYIAVVLHFFKQHAVIIRGNRELEINAALLNSINENPGEYCFCLEGWSEDKTWYINSLEELFADFIVAKEKEYNSFSYVVRAMQRWFISLSKYAKELKKSYTGHHKSEPLDKNNLKFINSLKIAEINAREYLFVKLIDIFECQTNIREVSGHITRVKQLLDGAVNTLKDVLVNEIRDVFCEKKNEQKSLYSLLQDWYEQLKESTRNHLFGTVEERFLQAVKDMTHNESQFIERLAKVITGLRIEDWDETTIGGFLDDIKQFKHNVELKDVNSVIDNGQESNIYKLVFVGKDQTETVKTFNKTECRPRAKLLFNDLASTLEEHGESISENEKRQVLMDLIEKLCK